MPAFSRSGSFENSGHLPFDAGFKKCLHVVLPCRLVEISSEEPTCFIA
jgi:hypothetical protein